MYCTMHMDIYRHILIHSDTYTLVHEQQNPIEHVIIKVTTQSQILTIE